MGRRIKKAQVGVLERRRRAVGPDYGEGDVWRPNIQIRLFGKKDDKTKKERKQEEKEFQEREKEYSDPLRTWMYDKRYPLNYRKGMRATKSQPSVSTAKSGTKIAKAGAKTPAWQRKEGKNPSGGLNAKGVASYRRANPGSKLKTAVTTKPSKLKPGSKAANRRKSFCSRMSGMKKKLTSAKTANDPNSRINKSLRKWNC